MNRDGSMDWTVLTGRIRTTYPVDHLGTSLPSARHDASSRVDFGDACWDGDYWDPGAYSGGVALRLRSERDLTFALREHRAQKSTAVAEVPLTNLERHWENRLLAELDEDVQRPLRRVDGRDVRWLDHLPRRYQLDHGADDPTDNGQPAF